MKEDNKKIKVDISSRGNNGEKNIIINSALWAVGESSEVGDGKQKCLRCVYWVAQKCYVDREPDTCGNSFTPLSEEPEEPDKQDPT